MSPSQIHLDPLQSGIDCFNRGEYFEAHEHWEIDWRRLSSPDRPLIQAAILVCGVFVLLRKGRRAPAIRLAEKALERFAEAATQAKLRGITPCLDLPETEERMLRFLARARVAEGDTRELAAEFSHGLRAYDKR